MDVLMPKLNANEDSAVITKLYIADGSFIKKNSLLIEIEDTKTVSDIISEADGYVKLLCAQGDEKKAGERIAIIFKDKEEYDAFISDSIMADNKAQFEINATKKAIELAEKNNIDLLKLAENKKGALIKTDDVQQIISGEHNKEIRNRINTYDRERVVLIGAGKGAEIVIDILLDDRNKYIVGLADTFEKDFPSYSYPLLGCTADKFPDAIDSNYYDTVILTMGSTMKTMKVRKELFELYTKKGIKFTNAVADDACFRRATRLGVGNIIPHRCYFGTGTIIGDNNAFSYGVNIGHHCQIGNHNLLGPAVVTAGCVTIGSNCVLSTGVNTCSHVTIGSNVFLPVGFSVNEDIADNAIMSR